MGSVWMLLHSKGLHKKDFLTCLMKLPVTRVSLTADGFEKTNILYDGKFDE
jgi:hypothetical protein